MDKKLLVICGPTAIGKTSLAIALAKKFNGEIVSADSRQVYKGMDIGTGKEWGKDVVIHGYDLVDPKKEFSISQYLRFAKRTIGDIIKRGKLPILVGGTGFYIKGVIDGIPTVSVPRNEALRKNLEGRETEDLFEKLAQIDSVRAGQMNSSDKRNPRRLIRAIEVATWKLEHSGDFRDSRSRIPGSILMVGLTAPKDILEAMIGNRVDARVKTGIKNELRRLIDSGVDWSDQSMQALGYKQWRDYFEGEVPEEVVTDEWKREERKYARRQLTWFRKDKRINWFDTVDGKFGKEVENLIKKWYTAPDAKKS